MSSLEYAKIVLEKVSFDPKLFTKEYYKAIHNLLESEVFELYEWCVKKFGQDFMQSCTELQLV
ncbi:MAG: hypothetical protein HKN92_02715 [Chitinophagales bacterium]|nr:hypothetical protein [Chitinophagales bacterium]